MKGISTILATILIVIIVVALVSLTYTFAVGLFTTSAKGATAGTEALTTRLQQSVEIVGDGSCDAVANNITFSIRNSGTETIPVGGLSVLIQGKLISDASVSPNITAFTLSQGQLKQYNAHTADELAAGTRYTLTVSAPAGSVDKTVSC